MKLIHLIFSKICFIIISFFFIEINSNAYAFDQDVINSTSLISLDGEYGQGKFNKLSDFSATLWLLQDGLIKIKMPNEEEGKLLSGNKSLANYLKTINKVCSRMTVVLSDIPGAKLEISRQVVEICNNAGYRTIVVKDERQMQESFLSTYKYARIYSIPFNDYYELDHNGLTFQGTAKEIAAWIEVLGIESVAFFPDDAMTWKDASIIIEAEKSRGGRSFSICTPIQDDSKPAIITKENGKYQTIFIPSDLELSDRNRNCSLIEVNKMLLCKLTKDCLKNAEKVIDNPYVFFCPNPEMKVISAAFHHDEFVLVLKRQGLGRNTWYKPDMNTKIIADGKEYKLIKDDGFEDFSKYPYKPEYGYANGCLCWVPENGELYNTLHFEPIPNNTNSVDMIGTREYAFYGIQLGTIDEHKDTEVIEETLLVQQLKLDKTKGGDMISIRRIEQTPTETVICMDVLINADFTYKARFNDDFELILYNGSRIGCKRIEGIPVVNREYVRAGDLVCESPRFIFPKLEYYQLKHLVLSGTICNTKVELRFGYSRPDPLLESLFSF